MSGMDGISSTQEVRAMKYTLMHKNISVADVEIDDPDDFVNYVVLDMGAYSDAHAQKSVRKNITIPSWLNAYGEAHHVNFSRILHLKTQFLFSCIILHHFLLSRHVNHV